MQNKTPQLLTPDQASKYLGISTQTLKLWEKKNLIVPHRIDRKSRKDRRYTIEQLDYLKVTYINYRAPVANPTDAMNPTGVQKPHPFTHAPSGQATSEENVLPKGYILND